MPANPSPPAEDLAAALSQAVAVRPGQLDVARTALLLAVAALVALVLDTEGLLGWARRVESATGRHVALAVLEPLHDGLARVGLTAPRRWAAGGRDALERLVGTNDPLLARGWVEEAQAPVRRPNVIVAPTTTLLVTAPPTGGVLLLGDSMMAGSLGSTLERSLSRTGLHVTRAAQLGTGLARPDLYDWMRVVPSLLERDQPRFVIVSLGANDATTLREGDEDIEYGEPRWREVYQARVEVLMRTLAASQARVLWLSLPPMRERRLSARAASLNGLFAATARRVPRVELLELDVLVGDRERQYATFVQGKDGRLVRYRLDDGVHLAPAGAQAVARWVGEWLAERTAR
ncbi:MAG: DUF459 domain-containing protein [Myxococcota bacterium]